MYTVPTTLARDSFAKRTEHVWLRTIINTGSYHVAVGHVEASSLLKRQVTVYQYTRLYCIHGLLVLCAPLALCTCVILLCIAHSTMATGMRRLVDP